MLGSPFLNNGMTIAFFNSYGTIPVVIERLMICSKGSKKQLAIFFIILGSKLSHPGLEFLKVFMIVLSCSLFTGSKNSEFMFLYDLPPVYHLQVLDLFSQKNY